MLPEGTDYIGASIELSDNIRADSLLFGETQSRIIITAASDKVAEIERIGEITDTPIKVIGRVGGERLIIRRKSDVLIDLPVRDIADTWRKAIPRYLGEA